MDVADSYKRNSLLQKVLKDWPQKRTSIFGATTFGIMTLIITIRNVRQPNKSESCLVVVFLIVLMLRVVIQFVKLSVVMLSTVMLSDIKLSSIVLSNRVIRLGDFTPIEPPIGLFLEA